MNVTKTSEEHEQPESFDRQILATEFYSYISQLYVYYVQGSPDLHFGMLLPDNINP